jgi:tripartite-type tricarboxylate transporter receptor subunit TctC
MSGQVEMMLDAITTMAPIVNSGRVRALGTTGGRRSTVLPAVPTIAEAGMPGYEATIWLGVMAPAGTPRLVIERLNAEIVKIVARSDVRKAWNEQGAEPMTMTPGEFEKYLNEDIVKWAKVIRDAGIKAD